MVDEQPAPQTLSDEEIAELLPRLEAAENWIKDIKAEAQARAVSGRTLPGYKLVSGRSVAKWLSDHSGISAKLQEAGIEPWRKELITITEAKKQLGKGGKDLIDRLTVKPEGKPTLVPESDKRPALGGTASAIADFEND